MDRVNYERNGFERNFDYYRQVIESELNDLFDNVVEEDQEIADNTKCVIIEQVGNINNAYLELLNFVDDLLENLKEAENTVEEHRSDIESLEGEIENLKEE